MLKVSRLVARVSGKEVLKGLDFDGEGGKVHMIMGPNGSGKSSLVQIIMGDSSYEVAKGEIRYEGKKISKFEAYERAKRGIFLAYQSPVSIPGVSVFSMMRRSYEIIKEEKVKVVEFRDKLKDTLEEVGLPGEYYKRYVNDGFSGGERKRLELAQMLILEPKLIMLDEIDSGLDIDSLKIVGRSVKRMKEAGSCVIVITHYGRIAEQVKPDKVHILKDGIITKEGGSELVRQVESSGYGGS